jgi:hypothetical protein
LPIISLKSVAFKKVKGDSSMALKSITATAAADPGREAIEICMQAWKAAHDARAKIDTNKYECLKAGNQAFFKAAPPLIGYKNICVFIACINYAAMTGIAMRKEAAHYLNNAKIALSTIYHNPDALRERNRGKSNGKKNK